MEHESSLQHSQELCTCPYPEPDKSSPYQTILSLQDPSRRDACPLTVCKTTYINVLQWNFRMKAILWNKNTFLNITFAEKYENINQATKWTKDRNNIQRIIAPRTAQDHTFYIRLSTGPIRLLRKFQLLFADML
jgi:hypothetical protein